jgi:uncharacterized protein (TIGR02996 family)
MTDREALLQTILDNPDDDLPRLIFADWLEETGEPSNVARAEFIRLQCKIGIPHWTYAKWLQERGDDFWWNYCLHNWSAVHWKTEEELTRSKNPDKVCDQLIRSFKMIVEYGRSWTPDSQHHLGHWVRGFLYFTTIYPLTDLPEEWIAFFSEHPIEYLYVFGDFKGGRIRRGPLEAIRLSYFCDNDYLSTLRRLQFMRFSGSVTEIEKFTHTKSLPRLCSLEFDSCEFLESDIRCLIQGPLLKQLRGLTLSRCWLEDNAIEHLLNTSSLQNIEILNLHASVGSESLRDKLRERFADRLHFG